MSNLLSEFFPERQHVETVLSNLGLPEAQLRGVLQGYAYPEKKVSSGKGYQVVLAEGLSGYLRRALQSEEMNVDLTRRYCERLGECADLVLRRRGATRAVFFEIEFRPNVEKD